ncbi:MAG TPA: response regulator transcription factor [Phycisphaerales bacterium]|nr:response regulator transcription factor [Phycisphaerales bacterium]
MTDNSPQRMIKVLLVDDNRLLGMALQMKLSAEPDLRCVGRLESADHLVEEVLIKQPDVILLDIEMPGRDSFAALAEVTRRRPASRAVMLTAHIREAFIDAAIVAGAWGYVCKGDRPEAILDAVRKVARGEFALGQEVVEHCRRSGSEPGLDLAGPRSVPGTGVR